MFISAINKKESYVLEDYSQLESCVLVLYYKHHLSMDMNTDTTCIWIPSHQNTRAKQHSFYKEK
jgi:hypothetical protein